MSKRTININPQFFNISKKKGKTQKIMPSQVNINSSNIRQLLLDKLREHKKTKKIETTRIPVIQEKSFDENCKDNEVNETKGEFEKINVNSIPIIKNNLELKPSIQDTVKDTVNLEEVHIEKQLHVEVELKDKPYGNLKNGIKPTFKSWSNPNNVINEKLNVNSIPIINENLEKEVKKIFKLGKNEKNKTISILIKNNKTRKKIEDSKIEFKKKNLSTVKNYLKEKNLIKFGSTAPSKLLREMYETSQLCGGISNENAQALIHNFDK